MASGDSRLGKHGCALPGAHRLPAVLSWTEVLESVGRPGASDPPGHAPVLRHRHPLVAQKVRDLSQAPGSVATSRRNARGADPPTR